MVLISAFTKAVSDYNQMPTAQVTALARGDGFQFGVEMQSAGKAVGLAGATILQHGREHGVTPR
jgi:hypothetical protein